MRHYIHLILIIFFSLTHHGCLDIRRSEKESEMFPKYLVVGYIAGWTNFDINKVDADKLTHINYAFANIVDGEAKFENSADAENMEKIIDLKQKNPALKVLYSIGGWVWSNNFSDVAVSDGARKKFARSALFLMLKHNMDGIDLDWEYPGQRAEDNVYRPVDKRNFTLLLKEIREQLDELEKEMNRHYFLTIASGSDQMYIDHTELGKAQKYLDFINIMTYDFYHGWHYQTGHHANLFPSNKEKFGGNSMVEAVDRHLLAGVPASKLVVGIPFYGRQWSGVNPEHHGLYQWAKTPGTIIAYQQIKDSIRSGKYLKFWDGSAKAPYAWNKMSKSFISYEDEESLKLKIDFIKSKKLGGIMFWEYSLDPNNELLKIIDEKYKQE